MAGKGQYERLTEEQIKARDAELKAAGMLPKNPKQRSAAYRELLASKGKMAKNTVGTAGKKTEEETKKTTKPKVAKLVKMATKKKVVAVAIKKHEQPPTEKDLEYRRISKLNHLEGHLHILCLSRNHLGTYATPDQASLFSGLIDDTMVEYERAFLACYPPDNDEDDKDDPETDEEDTNLKGEAVPVVPPPSEKTTPVMPLPPPAPSVLPTPPGPPPLPSFCKPPTV